MIEDVLRAAEAAVMLIAARAVTLALPFNAVAAILGDTSTAGDQDASPRATIDPRAAAIALALARAAARLPWRSTCLVQAIAGHVMLRRRGIPASLVIGVRKDGDALAAHAWLQTADGYVCGGHDASTYLPLASFTRA